jgi:spore coat polysaccharide biosynthesis predicted glycosyltransferase SpsG/RimJ/RimL family protein N-acetyltransferase
MTICARSATLTDSGLVFEWRNHESSRKHSTNNQIIDKVEHEKWYHSRIKQIDDQSFWIFGNETSQLGYVRFDRSIDSRNTFEISICINPEFQNKGHGKEVLAKSVLLHFEKHPTSKIIARVSRNNSSSLSLFAKANFIEKISLDDFLVLELVNRNLRFVFRADASKKIGTGHTQRALGLIQELKDLGYEVIFIGDTSEVTWVTLQMNSVGFLNIFSKEQDFISNPKTDILILDTYTIPTNSEFINKSRWLVIALIHDLHTPEYYADIIIHPGVSENIVVQKNVKLLSGPKYVVLRKSIKRLQTKSKSSNLAITVVGGGVDQIGFACEMSKRLKLIPGEFIVNFFTADSPSIESDLRFQTFEFSEKLDEIGNQSDLIFCTSSSISLEFIARGCAVGIVCGSCNQQQYYRSLPKLGVAEAIGVYQDDTWVLDLKVIQNLISSKSLRDKLSKKSLELIDFDGAKRVVNEIMNH